MNTTSKILLSWFALLGFIFFLLSLLLDNVFHRSFILNLFQLLLLSKEARNVTWQSRTVTRERYFDKTWNASFVYRKVFRWQMLMKQFLRMKINVLATFKITCRKLHFLCARVCFLIHMSKNLSKKKYFKWNFILKAFIRNELLSFSFYQFRFL